VGPGVVLAVRFVVGTLAMDPLRHALVDYKAHNQAWLSYEFDHVAQGYDWVSLHPVAE